MKPTNRWKREWFTRDMPLGEGTPLTASFELYDSGVIGIHLSCCFDGAMILKDALRIIVHFRTRTEYDETGKGIYILVKGELPYFDGYEGLKIDTYYLTGRTIVYEDIIENQEAIDWFFDEYGLFMRNVPDSYYSENYYKTVSMDGDVLKISMPTAKKGSRHTTLLSYGGRLLAEGLPMDHVEVKMYDFNMLYCVPPLQYSEFEGIVKSVKKYSQERDGESE